VLFLQGVAKLLFLPLALTITFSLLMSFWVSRTVTPLLCLHTLKAEPPGTVPRGVAGVVHRAEARLDQGYARALGWVLRHRTLTIVAILGLFLGSLLLSRVVGSEFFPETDESQFAVLYKAPMGTRVEGTEQIAMRIEQGIRRVLPPISEGGTTRLPYTTILANNGIPAGRGGLFAPNTGPHSGTIMVNLVPKPERPFSDLEATRRVRMALRNEVAGTQVFFYTGGIVKRILNMGSSAPIDVEILGYDLDVGAEYAKKVLARMRELRDKDGNALLTDVQVSREENYPELNVVVDRQKAGVLGLHAQEIAQSILASLVGNTQFAPVPFTDPKTGNEYYINVRLDDPYRSAVSDLSNVLLRTPARRVVTLDTVAKVERGSGPVLIQRKYMQRIIEVTANVAPGKSLGAASAATQGVIDKLPPPEGYGAQLSGQTAAQKEAFASLGFAALLALILVYMVLASQFKSLLHPLVIMFSVPMGLTGVFVALYLTRTTISVNSFMGIIMMVGIVVSNGVLLVEFTNTLRRRGLPIGEAIVQAGRTRLRPIIMTSLATVVGLSPMAIGYGEGSETNMPLARAVIGGLSVSTVFTLFLVPALYSSLDRFSRKRKWTEEEIDAPVTVGQLAPEAGPTAPSQT
jgi:multidrug efflux pump subunit AcrB